MHMSDALISPAVGAAMAGVSAAALVWSGYRMKKDGFEEKKVPLMGVLGAFVFAGQMINFTIPGTGSSGHIGGGLLLAALLGPYPALLTLAAVLIIQCLFFADGGLLALGCNIFNMGVCACLIACPLIYRPIAGKKPSPLRLTLGSVLAVVFGLQLGSFGVVLETTASGITALPFGVFAAMMQPIHLAIGLVEGLVTGAVLSFVQRARPELLETAASGGKLGRVPMKKVLGALLAGAVLLGGGVSLFASAFPDGLEWSVQKVTGSPSLEAGGAVQSAAAALQEKTAFLPDYSFSTDEDGSAAGTSLSGIVGGGLTLLAAGGVGLALSAWRGRRRKEEQEDGTRE